MPQKVMERELNMPVSAFRKMIETRLKSLQNGDPSLTNPVALTYQWKKRKTELLIRLKDYPITVRMQILKRHKVVTTVMTPLFFWPLAQSYFKEFEAQLDDLPLV